MIRLLKILFIALPLILLAVLIAYTLCIVGAILYPASRVYLSWTETNTWRKILGK